MNRKMPFSPATLFLPVILCNCTLQAAPMSIAPGFDLFESPSGSSSLNFSGPSTIPAGFFGPGSDPFTGVVALGGEASEQEPECGGFGDVRGGCKRGSCVCEYVEPVERALRLWTSDTHPSKDEPSLHMQLR